MRRKGTRKLWSYKAGRRGARVRVLEKVVGGPLYWTARESVPRSLGHRNREDAIAFPHEKAAELERCREHLQGDRPTAARVFGEYLELRTPRKREQSQQRDRRLVAAWTRYLGPGLDLERELEDAQLQTYVDLRRSGEMDTHGNYPVPEAERRPVRDRTLQSEIVWLRSVVHWAMGRRTGPGRFLITTDPTRGFRPPSEKNVRRPLMSDSRHAALLSVAEQVSSDLRTLLILAHEMGRRLSSILSLRWEDVSFAHDSKAPWGRILWRADADKMGREGREVMTQAARDALTTRVEIARLTSGGQPGDYLFPAPKSTGHVTKRLAITWLERAEKMAGLEHRPGLGWHGYRRLWVTTRKHHADADLCRLGGWKDARVLRSVYEQPDPDSTLRALTDRVEVHEES